MALLKNFVTPFGVTGNYWKITGISLQMGFSIAHISCYVDQTARQANAEPLISKEICIDGGIPVANMATDDPYKIYYDAIKAHTIRGDEQVTSTDEKGVVTWFFDGSQDI